MSCPAHPAGETPDLNLTEALVIMRVGLLAAHRQNGQDVCTSSAVEAQKQTLFMQLSWAHSELGS